MEKVKLKLNRPLPEEFKRSWGGSLNPKLHKKGWVTWVNKRAYDALKEFYEEEGAVYLHPENNKYFTNFPFNWFDEI